MELDRYLSQSTPESNHTDVLIRSYSFISRNVEFGARVVGDTRIKKALGNLLSPGDGMGMNRGFNHRKIVI